MMTAKSFALCMTKACGARAGDHVLAAVSGGADSVALLCLLCEVRDALSLTVSCAHMEHGIRGEASLADMAFVRSLCEEKDVPFYAEQADVLAYAKKQGLGIEDAARSLRYAFLERTADRIGASHIALAHHAGDQAETVLMHAARGSDVRGLCGMRHRQGRIIRPLLGEMPEALRAYLEACGQSWREDETNADAAYARNRIRTQAMPAIEAAYPGATQALCRLALAAQRDEAHFDTLLDGLNLTRKELVDGVALQRAELAALDDALLGRAVVRELMHSGFGAQRAEAIDGITRSILCGEAATVNLTDGAHAYMGKTCVCLIHAQRDVPEVQLEPYGETVTPYGVLTVREAEGGETGDGITCQAVDAQMLSGCMVGGRREGDTLVPFGRHTPVKLKKLMIDAGVERPIRNSLPVIRKGDTILWAVGLRPSNLCAAQGGKRLMILYRSNSSHKA